MASKVSGKPITVKQTSKGVLSATIDPQVVASICLMKNATSGDLTFVTSHDYDGQIGPITPYPPEILTSQWAPFVHYGSVGSPSQSIGAVVYRWETPDGQQYDWMMSWLNIGGTGGETSRKVYTEIREKDYDNPDVWEEILMKLNLGTNHSEARWRDYSATLDVVPDDDVAIFKGIIKTN